MDNLSGQQLLKQLLAAVGSDGLIKSNLILVSNTRFTTLILKKLGYRLFAHAIFDKVVNLALTCERVSLSRMHISYLTTEPVYYVESSTGGAFLNLHSLCCPRSNTLLVSNPL